MPMRSFRSLIVFALAVCGGSVSAQPSVVKPGANFTLTINDAPFYPLGWNMIGQCLPRDAPLGAVARDTLLAHIERIRSHGSNAVLEFGGTGGRIIPSQTASGWYNWQSYQFTDIDGISRQRGHPKPGVYVAAMRRFMDLAYDGPDGTAEEPIYTIVSLHRFMVPEGQAGTVAAADSLSCPTFAARIEAERRHNVGGDIPPVDCTPSPRLLPLWEWNVRYVVQHLRDHSGLLGWYLWDEPEGISERHLFGIVSPGRPIPRYTGPESLPTPDLLRHAYRRVIDFEREEKSADYARHPIIVDLAQPEAFFSTRFSWSVEERLRPSFNSGPFDRTPEGGFHTPADILGLDASIYIAHTAARPPRDRHPWYWDPNFTSRFSEQIRDAVERDSLWAGVIVAAQAQLPTSGPFALPDPSYCTQLDEARTRLLNDRDIVWHLLTPQINGMTGQLYYAYAHTPEAGPGAEQTARINRLLQQFRRADLDAVFLTPPLKDGWQFGPIRVEALTNYYRSDPTFVGPIPATFSPGISAFNVSQTMPPEAYRVGNFGRAVEESGYGHATTRPGGPTSFEAHRLLRGAVHRYAGEVYVVVSNAYDARITASLILEPALAAGTLEEGIFDLNSRISFDWAETPERARATVTPTGATVALEFEPYEARVFRFRR